MDQSGNASPNFGRDGNKYPRCKNCGYSLKGYFKMSRAEIEML